MNHFFKENKKGVIGTAIFHVALILMLILFGFHTPLPFPAEEGILVNFGYEESGSGQIDPSPSQAKPVPETEASIEEPTQTPSPTKSSETNQEVITQNIEEAATLEEKKKEKPVEKTKEELEKEQVERERIEQERIDEIERKKQEEEIAKKRAEEERRRKEIEDRFKNTLGQGQNPNDNNSSGEGISEGDSNQGKENGDPNSNNYGDGKGLGDDGISFSLDGRGKVALPKPILQRDEYGTVVIEIRVNANGDVVAATPIDKGSTTTNQYLRELARNAALKARFTTKPNAPDQFGTITYRFILE